MSSGRVLPIGPYVCHHCGGPVDRLHKGWVSGEPMYCSAHHVLVGRDPVVLGNDALDYAQHLTSMTRADMILWPWEAMQRMAGPIMPARLTYIAAFPANGKTTFIAELVRHFVRVQKKRVLLLPLEADAGEVFLRLACMDVGVDSGDVLSGRLALRAEDDPIAAMQLDHVDERMSELRADGEFLRLLNIHNIPTLSVRSYRESLAIAQAIGAEVVIVDHVDHVEGEDGEGNDITISNAIQTHSLRAAKGLHIPFILATQLNESRTGGDKLAHYRTPQIGWMYNKGKKDQVGAHIYGLSRMLDPNLSDEDERRVKAGTLDVSSISMPNRMCVTNMKGRYGSDIPERSISLEYLRGRISDLPDLSQRDDLAARHGIALGSPSRRFIGGND